MGAWGSGIFSNDTASDVKDMYHDLLAYGYDDLKAESEVISYWLPEVGGTEEEPTFWFALAALEHKYGRLSDAVREKALYYVEHPEDDLVLWEGTQLKKRKAAINKLASTLDLPSERKKVPPLRTHKTTWKPGDIILVKIEKTEEGDDSFFAIQVFDILSTPYSIYIKDGPQEQTPVIGIYRWIGKNPPDTHELVQHGFVKRRNEPNSILHVSCLVTTERECKKYKCTVLENSRLYLDYVDEEDIKRQIGSVWGTFQSSIAKLQYQLRNVT